MCGIAGIVDFGRPVEPGLLGGMLQAMVHRGPDDEGRYERGPCAIGMRRLSIIDLGGGHQPIANEDDTVWVVFNGEIYNYVELRRDLEARGHRFRTRTDTEVLVHLYEEKGDAFADDLNGMFAVALWDLRRQRVVLARDPVGIKPLYWHWAGGRLTFASELKCLLHARLPAWDVDREALAAYLHLGYIPREGSPIRGVRKLTPGSRLTWEQGGEPRVATYWRLADFFNADRVEPDVRFREDTRAVLDDAIRIQLRSDVPVGCFLSGGLDSSAIAVHAARHLPKIDTFGIGFTGHYFDEMPYARAVAAHAATRHHEQTLDPSNLPGLIERLAWHLDEPNSDPAMLPSYLICRYAREVVKVALSGAGGDELFAGYPRHWDAPPSGSWACRFRGFVPRAMRRALLALAGVGPPARERLLADNNAIGLSYWADHAADPALAGVAPWADAFSPVAWIDQVFGEVPDADDINRRCYYDATTYLPDQILAMTDRASMAVSLEVRVPLLDKRLVERMALVGGAAKVRDGGKTVFKQMLRGDLPDDVIDRRKLGFGLPVVRWIGDPAIAALLRELPRGHLAEDGYVDGRAIETLLDRRDVVENRWPFFWNLVMLELWYRQYTVRSTGKALAADEQSR